MKVAIIGSEDVAEKICTVLNKKFRGVEWVHYQVDRILDTEKVFETIDLDVDGLIFTGIGFYSEAMRKGEYNIPCVYTGLNILSIIQTFYKIHQDVDDLSKLRIGMDTLDEGDLLDFFEEFNIRVKEYDIVKYVYPMDEEEFVEKYRERYENGEIDCILTASNYVYKSLSKEDIPVYRLMANKLEIHDKYLDLKKEIELNYLSDKLTYVKIFKIKEENYNFITKKDKKKIKDDLFAYSKGIEGMFKQIDEDEFMILSSRKSTRSNENIRSLSNMIKIYENLGIFFAVGIGEGETLYQAEINSRNAVRRSQLDEGSSIFFYDGNKVVGPIFDENQIEYSTAVDERHEKLVEEIGISYQYIEKIKGAKKKLGRDEFTSKELAELLLISERTANRLLKKIIENGYAEEVGKEVSLGVGRPRRKIKLLF